MTVTIEAGKTYIRTLRATGNERDALTFQLRVDQMLSAADLYPRGLSDSAIVCIRSFYALLPPAQQVRYGGGRLPARWEAHVRASLKQIIQQAAHPLHGNASSSSEAVIFADRAEMLASLAIDWRTGIYAQRWWWRSLFRGANVGYMLLPAWLETPEYIPAALAHLAAKREAVPFVRRLSTHEARSLLQSITRTFALRELQSVLSTLSTRNVTTAPEAFHQPSNNSPHSQPSSPTVMPTKDITTSNGAVGAQFIAPVDSSSAGYQQTEYQQAGYPQGDTPTMDEEALPARWSMVGVFPCGYPAELQSSNPGSSTLSSQAPWRQWVPESMDGNLPLEHQALLGIGLMLLRIPSIVRSTSFAEAVYRWHTNTYNPTTMRFSATKHTDSVGELHPGDDEGSLSVRVQREVHSEEDEDRTGDEKGQFVAPYWEAAVPSTREAGDGESGDREPAARVPARGTPTMDEQARPTHRSMVGVPLAGTLVPGALSTQREHMGGGEKKRHAQSTRQNISFLTETSGDVDVDVLTTPTNDTTTDKTNALPSQRANESSDSPSLPEKRNSVGTRLARPEQAPERGRARASLAPTEFPRKDDVTDKVVETITSTPVSVNEGGSATDNIAETRAPAQAKRHEQSLSMPTTMIDILSPRAYDRRIETMYGGLFYLINLGLFLDLYGDFTMPLQGGIDLPMWDFMALLGEQMLGESIYTDPVWSLLAQLAGRATESTETIDGNDSAEAIHTTDNNQEPPGLYFEPPEQWRVPVQWLSAFPETGGWRWSKEDGRLRVKHPAQFLLLDLPLMNNVEPVEQLKHELQPYTDFFEGNIPELDYVPPGLRSDESLLPCGQPVVRELARALSPALRRWLCWLMPYIYARLQRALGMEEEENPSTILCRHQAFISVSATHLRIDLALAELPIAIRIAGLDRDPGWVPVAGRFIAFHFT